jgi:hypothetical protein
MAIDYRGPRSLTAREGGAVYVNSGYGMFSEMPGNVLLVFSVDGK